MKGRNTTMSEFYCVECGSRIYLPRCTGQQRKDGHIKHIWCTKCKQETAHVEIKSKGWNGITLADKYKELSIV